MILSVKESTENDLEKIVDYFLTCNESFLIVMGVDKKKLPKKREWINKLIIEMNKPYSSKEYFYLTWILNEKAIGHSNVNEIIYGEEAKMHLHLWNNSNRKSGLGLKLLKQSIDIYFKVLKLNKLICEPKADNYAPNKILRKLGFKFIREYQVIPGDINFSQTVKRYELTKL